MQNTVEPKVAVKLSYGQLKRRPGTLAKLADVLAFIETCPEMPSYFFLKYKDDEGDMMTVTSEKEFQEALQLCARQKLLSIEVVAANEKDVAVLKKGEKLPAEDEEPFQIVVPEPGAAAEIKDQKKDGDNKKPVEASKEASKPTEIPKEVPKPNAFIAAMDNTVTPVQQIKKELTPLEQLDALLATLSKDVNAQFRLTRASFVQELSVTPLPADKEKPQPQPLNDSKSSTPEAKKESPSKKEEKRGSQSDASKPSLLRPNSKYAQQIEELSRMGFTKVEAVEKLLEKYKGSVQKALNVLVTEGS